MWFSWDLIRKSQLRVFPSQLHLKEQPLDIIEEAGEQSRSSLRHKMDECHDEKCNHWKTDKSVIVQHILWTSQAPSCNQCVSSHFICTLSLHNLLLFIFLTICLHTFSLFYHLLYICIFYILLYMSLFYVLFIFLYFVPGNGSTSNTTPPLESMKYFWVCF